MRPEAAVLDNMRLAFYANELNVPVVEEPELPVAEQLPLAWQANDEEEDEVDV